MPYTPPASSSSSSGGQLSGKTGAVSSIVSATSPADASVLPGNLSMWQVSGVITVTAESSTSLYLEVSWTDETDTARTSKLLIVQPSGTTGIVFGGSIGVYLVPSIAITCYPSTTITVSTVVASGSSITYDVSAALVRLA